MTRDSLCNQDWDSVVGRLGGAERLSAGARATRAFVRPRVVESATDLLRLILAYCLGERGLRATAAWAAASGLADISNVGLLYRLRQCGDWLAMLVGQALAAGVPAAGQGRLIRIVDATAVAKAGTAAGKGNQLWRIHSAFDVPNERFGWFELTDESGGERLDRIPVVKGEIRLGDRAYLQPDRMQSVLDAGADLVVRAGWRSARWLNKDGSPFGLIRELREAAPRGWIDQPIWLGRKSAASLALRIIAVRKPVGAAAVARRKARRDAQRERYQISKATLAAADWVILITSLKPEQFSAHDVLALYRLRWRIELGFKRLKSLIGLKRPPGTNAGSARPYLLAHLLLILLLEPLTKEIEDSPHWHQAA